MAEQAPFVIVGQLTRSYGATVALDRLVAVFAPLATRRYRRG